MIPPATSRRVVYAMHESPLGWLGLAATDHGVSSLMLRVDEMSYVHYLQNNFNALVMALGRPLTSSGLAPDGVVGDHSDTGGSPASADQATSSGKAAVAPVMLTTGATPPAGAPIPAEAAQVLTRARLFLDRYFAGKQITFEGPFDLLQGSLFQRGVWATLRTIPYGEVRSYRWLAGMVGHPGAYRAVGSASGQNPVPILLPCHRVVHAGGGLGGYSGGLDAKRRLLALERVPLAALTPPQRAGSRTVSVTLAAATKAPLRPAPLLPRPGRSRPD